MSKENERRPSGRSASETPPYSSPYEYTKAGLIGEQRETMLQSELQILVRRFLFLKSIEFFSLFSPNSAKHVDVVIDCHQQRSPMELQFRNATVA